MLDSFPQVFHEGFSLVPAQNLSKQLVHSMDVCTQRIGKTIRFRIQAKQAVHGARLPPRAKMNRSVKLRDLLIPTLAGSTGLLLYGCLYAANRLVVERRTIRLKGWPRNLDGYTIAVLADLHIRDTYSVKLGRRAVEMALEGNPDLVVLPGDLVGYWKPESPWLLEQVLEPLILMRGSAIATPGNREYWEGLPELLVPVLQEFQIKYLCNEVWLHDGIQWAGIDSANLGQPDPIGVLKQTTSKYPTVVLWHEPDMVDQLPPGANLMISGHSHGGQFRTPWGWAPMKTKNGVKYLDGYFPEAPTPLYVSRGIGTTGPPSRLNCPPEVSLLRLQTA
jgi:predicted MPP superfamily phosphohydrolase